MLSATFAIAKNTFREAVRDRILYGILGFGILYSLTVIFLAKLSLGEILMIKSFGLAGVYIFGLIITIFLGASSIHREIERRTLYFVLSKPVSRSSVILGKFLGLYAAIALTVLIMALFYLGVIATQGGGLDLAGFIAILFQLGELLLLTAFLILVSAIASPLVGTICAAMAVLAGHGMNVVRTEAMEMGPASKAFFDGVYYIFPNLNKFDIRTLAAHAQTPPLETGLSVLMYALLYTVFLLAAAVLLLRQKEL